MKSMSLIQRSYKLNTKLKLTMSENNLYNGLEIVGQAPAKSRKNMNEMTKQ